MDVFQVANYKDYLFDTAKTIFGIDSPTGYYHAVIKKVEEIATGLGYQFEQIEKGCGIITIEGEDNSRTVMMAAHVDTLGLMVRSITPKGELKFTKIGGPILPTLDGEYCRIRTRDGKVYTGTILCESAAVHVHPDASTRAREEESMIVRIDEQVHCKEDVLKLGIQPGDYICFDPKTVVTESGFLKSRFIDDKGSVTCLLTALKMMKDKGLKMMKDKGLKPHYKTKFFISVFEEVGHGASYVPADVREVVAVDMGCIGLDLTCTEYDVSICAKDSGGPYDYLLTSHLIDLAKENGLKYAVDIYPRYSSPWRKCFSRYGENPLLCTGEHHQPDPALSGLQKVIRQIDKTKKVHPRGDGLFLCVLKRGGELVCRYIVIQLLCRVGVAPMVGLQLL